jgi:hypothetical protein
VGFGRLAAIGQAPQWGYFISGVSVWIIVTAPEDVPIRSQQTETAHRSAGDTWASISAGYWRGRFDVSRDREDWYD